MYSRQQASELRQAFWTALGKYMQPILSAEGEKVNWVNYKTGEKNIYFRMNAGSRSSSIAIEITHPNTELQQLYFEQFVQLKTLLHSALNEEWNWQLHFVDNNGKVISRIYKELNNVSLFNQNDWPALISFFKPRIIALDEFWSSARYGFEALR
jgi:hypothetical protein